MPYAFFIQGEKDFESVIITTLMQEAYGISRNYNMVSLTLADSVGFDDHLGYQNVAGAA